MSHSELEQHIHDALEARDPVTCRKYAEHAAGWVDTDLLVDICEAIILSPNSTKLLLAVGTLDAGLGLSLSRLNSHIDRHRAEFMEEEASEQMKALEVLDDQRVDENFTFRRIA